MRVFKHWYRLPRGRVDDPALEKIAAQVGRGSGQPDLDEAVPAQCSGEGLDGL